MNAAELFQALVEIRNEITRVNQSCGQVVFNPAITAMVDGIAEACGNPDSFAGEVFPEPK